MRDIGFLNLTRFGDLIQTTPVLKSLRKRHADARIHLIVKSRFRPVADMLPAVDVIHEIDGDVLARSLSRPGIRFVERFKTVREVVERITAQHYEVVYNFTHTRASAVLLSLMNAERTVGFRIDRRGQRLVDHPWLNHMGTLVRARRLAHFNLVDMYLGAAGLSGSAEPVSVRVSEAARLFAQEQLPGSIPRVAVQLGASTDTKTWSVERFAATLNELHQRLPQLRVVLVGVPSEAEGAKQLQATCPGVTFEDFVGKTRIDELAGLLERVSILLTGDTGTMHLAAAVGTTTCSVFVGLGTPYETAVYAEGHWALRSRIDCAPCAHYVKCGHTVCHQDIPPTWLADLLQRIIEEKPADDLPRLPRADLLRTEFNADGLLDLVPVHRREPDAYDLLSSAYRANFVESFEGIPANTARIWQEAAERYGILPDEWPQIIPEEIYSQLGRIEQLASRAEQLAKSLENSRDALSIRDAGKTLQDIDQSVYAISRSEPLLAPLGLTLESALENLPEADLPSLAAMSREHYRNLQRGAALMRELVASPSTVLTQGEAT